MSKTLKEVQSDVDNWIKDYKIGYFSPLSQGLMLAEEAGEVARALNCMYGDKIAKENENLKSLEEELGDVLFIITCLANDLGISLDKAFESKLKKLYGRDKDRYEKK